LILTASILLCAQQFVGAWSFAGPYSEAKEIAAIEKIIAGGGALNGFKAHEAKAFYGHFDVAYDLGQESVASVFYQHKIIAKEDKVWRVRMGSDDGLKVWLNGELILQHEAERGTNPSEEHLLLPLVTGDNYLAIRVINTGGAWSFSINDEKLANPIEVDRAIRRGTDHLIQAQALDGSWGFHKGAYRNGATSLAVYTLLSCGISPQSATVQKGLSFISATYPEKTYSAGCQLMALAELNDPQYYEQMEVIVSDLISWQERNGMWAYPGGHWDLSCTQFAILGLYAAANIGIDVPDKVWRDAIEGILLCETEIKGKAARRISGFRYHPGYSATGTLAMTAAAVASIEICRQQLGGKYPQKLRKKAASAAKSGLAWITQNFTVARNFGFNGHRYYAIYGLERVGSILDLSKFGEHDWYNEGAGFLLDAQHTNGGWPNTTVDFADTLYSLLFLKRATAQAAITGEYEVRSSNEVVSENLDGRLRLHVNNGDPVVMWTALPDGLKTTAVTYAIRRHANAPWQPIGESSANRFAYTHSFPGVGKWLVRAECVADGQQVNSTDVVYYYVPNLRPDDTSYGDDEFENLISVSRATVTTSTEVADYFGGKQLVDGSLSTRWFCKVDDALPEFTISMRRSAKATILLFSHIYTSPSNIADRPRPTEVEVYINHEKDPIVVSINPDQSQKTIYAFEKKRSITKLRVVITKVVDGTLGKASIGFSEIELQR